MYVSRIENAYKKKNQYFLNRINIPSGGGVRIRF